MKSAKKLSGMSKRNLADGNENRTHGVGENPRRNFQSGGPGMKFCKDCWHSNMFRSVFFYGGHLPSSGPMCARRRADVIIDPVFGDAIISNDEDCTPCYDDRCDGGDCGPDAKYFEPKQ